jgi:hypothetical protein
MQSNTEPSMQLHNIRLDQTTFRKLCSSNFPSWYLNMSTNLLGQGAHTWKARVHSGSRIHVHMESTKMLIHMLHDNSG